MRSDIILCSLIKEPKRQAVDVIPLNMRAIDFNLLMSIENHVIEAFNVAGSLRHFTKVTNEQLTALPLSFDTVIHKGTLSTG